MARRQPDFPRPRRLPDSKPQHAQLTDKGAFAETVEHVGTPESETSHTRNIEDMPYGLVFTLRYDLNGTPNIDSRIDASYILGPQGAARLARSKLLDTEDFFITALYRSLHSLTVRLRYNNDEYGPFMYRDDKPINAGMLEQVIRLMPYERRKEFLARAKI